MTYSVSPRQESRLESERSEAILTLTIESLKSKLPNWVWGGAPGTKSSVLTEHGGVPTLGLLLKTL